ncbi:hypothetical protein A2310_08880 [candidate division WOR-1 bacterium RIFOXYB2_FULL_37_13]|uniref:Uncharacterized protein n=1 Tax=candidate division WOR-1 bacterium RIFOXYB2_FULL_37_13 TaxID=1802579 RepID=A0A1F4SGZ0_UNCSA|nr:MAG: hypothetical protein A2310_08880 [candidate division WOR-1 bacterium RIFOXYB2_FULL_37_13]
MIYSHGNQIKVDGLAQAIRRSNGHSTVKPTLRLTLHQDEILRSIIGANSLVPLGMEERVGGRASEFIFRPEEKRLLPIFPVMVKIPRPRISRNSLEFTKRNLGGVVAPFVILEDVSVNGTRHPFVIVQQYQAVHLNGTLPSRYPNITDRNKVRGLILRMIERGILYYDALIAKHFGIDISTGDCYLLGGMHHFAFATRDEAFETVTDKLSEGIVRPRNSRTNRFFTQNWGGWPLFDRIGLPSDEELFELWGTRRGECQPVPDIMLYMK